MPKAVLRGLQAEHPVVKRAAVTEVFRQLGQHSQYQSAEGAALLQQCVSSKDRVSLPYTAYLKWHGPETPRKGRMCAEADLQCRLWLKRLFSS